MPSSTESFWSEIKSYEERLKNNPSSYCFAPLAEVYLRAGLLDDALAVSRAGVARYPGFVAGQMALARVCHQKGLVDECQRALEVVTGAVPEHAEAQRLLARLYSESGRGLEAGRALQALLEFCPDDVSARLELESIQRRFAVAAPEDDLELIEFTDADIVEEFEQEDLLVERVKPVAVEVDDPWAGVAVAPESVAVPEPFSEPLIASEPAAVQPVSDVDDVWSLPVQQVTPVEVPPVADAWAVAEQETDSDVEPAVDELWGEQEQQLASVVEPVTEDPLMTPTMAELYVSQGFPDKAIAIYRKLVETDSSNMEARARLAALEHPASAVEADLAAAAVAAVADQPASQVTLPAQGSADVQAKVTVLEGWLENIRRLRACR